MSLSPNVFEIKIIYSMDGFEIKKLLKMKILTVSHRGILER